MALPFQNSQIGPVFDVGVQTRDGSTLSVLNKDGKSVAVQGLAYMTSIDRANPVLEETELQEKDRLVQLSANLIDREFTQWPQVTQGDWSGGGLQRTLGGTSLSGVSAPTSDPTRFWDGTGLVWPLEDYVPQEPFMPGAFLDSAANPPFIPWTGQAIAAGVLASIANPFPEVGMGVTWVMRDNAGTPNSLLIFRSGVNRLQVTNPNLILGGTAPTAPVRMCVGDNAIWYITGVTGVALAYVQATSTSTATATTVGTFETLSALTADVRYTSIGTQQYVAAAAATKIRIYNVTPTGTGAGFNFTSFVDLQLSQNIVMQLGWQGGNLLYSVSDSLTPQQVDVAGNGAWLMSYSVAAQTSSVLTFIPGATALYFTPVGGNVFILAIGASGDGTTGQVRNVSMYLLQGSTLTSLGSLIAQPFYRGVTWPCSYGPYAIFGVATTNSSLTIYAYNAVNNRFFKVTTLTGLGANGALNMANQGSIQAISDNIFRGTRPAASATWTPQWGIAVNPLQSDYQFNVADMYFQIQPTAGTGFGNYSTPPRTLQGNTQIISSLIDFTSAENKLYRQVVAQFLPLQNDAAATISLGAWLDKDPANLPTSPDFSINIAGNTSPGATVLTLPINQIARKVVYRVIAGGGGWNGSNWVDAPKLQSVAVQASTGWVVSMVLDLAPWAMPNNKGQNGAFMVQGFDHVAAYNFLRQLWRQKGGQCRVSFPNGDSYNALIQEMHFQSPKPFSPSMRADQQSSMQLTCSLKFREDL